MPSPDDIFYVIGFTRADIAVGALRNLISLSLKSLEQMTKLHQRVGPLAIAAARGVVVKEPIEVYFESPLDAEPGRNFRKEYGENYETVQFLKRNSDEALQRVRDKSSQYDSDSQKKRVAPTLRNNGSWLDLFTRMRGNRYWGLRTNYESGK